MQNALIAMSGGVDSGVAAFLTQQAGFSGIGCTMNLFARENTDAEDAKAIADRLGMAHYVFDLSEQFREKVIMPFVACYQCGKTPNPCIQCNRFLKFASLLEKAEQLGCDKLVTGHYAQVVETGEGWQLRRAADPAKDQSYVLYMLTQEQLARVFLPLGRLTKPEVRRIAEEQGFVNAHKHDSQDICFVPDGDYARIIREETGTEPVPGEFVDLQGNVLGQHAGMIHYTVGQRRGLGIAVGKPAYVVALDPAQNRVVIGDNADLFRHSCTVGGVNWIAGAPPQEPVRCQAKIRYRHPAQPATVLFTDAQNALLTFDEPQRAITAGQAAVFYDGETVLGGGEILSAGT
jgi:tRNA-specific 2-thiouridylase